MYLLTIVFSVALFSAWWLGCRQFFHRLEEEVSKAEKRSREEGGDMAALERAAMAGDEVLLPLLNGQDEQTEPLQVETKKRRVEGSLSFVSYVQRKGIFC